MFLTIISFLLVLSVLVIVHELGHFLTAKKMGVKVEEFGFGFPPRIFGKKIGETVYSINALPIGGFVKLYGEDDAGGGKVRIKNSEVRIKNDKRAFYARPAWQRLLIVVAGVVMNFLLAVVIVSYLLAVVGVPVPGKNVVIAGIAKNSPAEKAGLKQGDIVLSVDSHLIYNAQSLIEYTKKHLGQNVRLRIKDKRLKIKDIVLIPRVHYAADEGAIGISIGQSVETKKYPWYQAPFIGIRESFVQTWEIIKGLYFVLTQFIFKHKAAEGLAGPVGIAQITGQYVQMGFDAVLTLVAALSLNLAVLNILPIPALDGGRLFFIIVEMLTGKKVHPKFEAYAHTIGMVALLTFAALVTYRDILRIVAGKSLMP